MLVKVFRKVYWYTPLLLIFIGVVLWMDAFRDPASTMTETGHMNAPLFKLVQAAAFDYPLTSLIASFVLLMVQVFFVNHIASANNLTDRYSALTGLVYLLLMSSTPAMITMHPVLFSNMFLLLALNKTLKIYDEQQFMPEVYNTGLMVAIAGLFYLPVLIFVFFLFFSLIVYYQVSLRSVIASLLGLITPFFFLGLYYYLLDLLSERMAAFSIIVQPRLVSLQLPATIELLGILVLAFFSLIAFARLWLVYFQEKPIRIRKRIQVLFLLFIISVVSYLFAANNIHLHHAILAVPLSIALSVFFFDLKRRMLAEFIFGILLLFILISRFALL